MALASTAARQTASAFARTARVPCIQACVENGLQAVAMISCTRALATLTASAFARDARVPCILYRTVSGLGCGHPCLLCVMTLVGHTTPADRGVTECTRRRRGRPGRWRIEQARGEPRGHMGRLYRNLESDASRVRDREHASPHGATEIELDCGS